MPNPQDWKTSVFRVDGLSQTDVAKIGAAHVASRLGRPLHGWGRLTVQSVISVGLQIEADDVPKRHANIVGWPEGKARKSEQQLLAQMLAEAATLVLRTIDPPAQAATSF